MHFGFALDSPDIDLWNIDLIDTHLDLLHTDIPSKHFVCLQDVLKISWRKVFKTSSRHVFNTSSRNIQDMSSRRLEDVLRDLFKMSLQDVFKTSWKTKNCSAEDVLKTSSGRLEGQQMFGGNIFWHRKTKLHNKNKRNV